MNIRSVLSSAILVFGISSSLASIPSTADAKPGVRGDFGLGIIVGDPNAGISMKYWSSSNIAFDGALSWSGDWARIHGDYLIHLPHIIKVERGTLPVYYGFGLFVQNHKNQKIGIRIPVGLAYQLPTNPLEFFLEIVPKLTLIESSSFGIGVGLGGRFYF